MSFEIGQTVVYPHHGAATIEEVMTRTIRGEERTYLKLRVNQGDLEIQVPAENVDMVGVRDIVDEDGLEEVLSVLRAPYIEEPTNWSRRFKANQEKIATGDIVKVAEVVRDLTRRDDLKKLSTGEKRMLTKARGILTSELALARNIEKSAAAERLDAVISVHTTVGNPFLIHNPRKCEFADLKTSHCVTLASGLNSVSGNFNPWKGLHDRNERPRAARRIRGLMGCNPPSEEEPGVAMTDFLTWAGQNPWAAWGVLALLLAAAELLTMDLTLLMLAAGALAGGVVALLFPQLLWLQVIVALATAVATLFLLRPTLLEKARHAPGYRSSLDDLIGSFGDVTTRITANSGEAKVDGQIWQARSYDDTVTIETGERIEVYKLDGITLIVYPIAH